MSEHTEENTSENTAIAELKRFLFSEGYTERFNPNYEETILTSPDDYRWVTIASAEKDYAISVYRGSMQCSRGTGEWENLSMEELPEIYDELGF